jgi:hypothetical protein
MPFEMCALCGHLMQPDQRRPGWYTCACCENRVSPSRPQISARFILAVYTLGMLVGVVLLIWYLWGRH